jgi:thiol-disulfide isomerase/thioredoxin
MKRILSAAALLSSLAILVTAPPALAALNVGDKPSLEFNAVDGSKVSLAKLKGRIVVVDFWATWCGPCMAMADEMVEINKEFSPHGMQMIGISLDQDKASLAKIVKEKQFVWPQYFDGQGWENKVWKTWGESGIPFTVLISPDGEVLWKGHPGSGLKNQIIKAFKEHPPKLVDDKTVAAANDALTKSEGALKDNDAPAAIKALAAFPAGAKADADTLARYEKVAKELESAGDKMLAEADTLVEQKQYAAAVAKLKDLSSSLAGSAVGTKAKRKLADVQAMPEVKKALDDAAKASKSAEALATAQKLKASGKHELAYPRFKAIVKEFAGTDAAKTAAGEVAAYEKDPVFVKRVMEQEAGTKAKGALSVARAYGKSGNTQQARVKYQSIITDYPGTSVAKTAEEEMKALPK